MSTKDSTAKVVSGDALPPQGALILKPLNSGGLCEAVMTMPTCRVTVVNSLGLHARAAARFVKLAGQFRSGIQVTRGAKRVDGKSILGLLLLSAPRGSVLDIGAEGEDAAQALDALRGLVTRGFEDV